VRATRNDTGVYLRFIEITRSRPGTALPDLSPHEGRLFEYIALAQQRGENLSVRSVMALRQLGSPASVPARLKALRASGWIMLADTHNACRKHVVPTPAAWRHLAWLARCVLRVVRKHAAGDN
jgi:hypothetical protein